jgi:hypothetical protein
MEWLNNIEGALMVSITVDFTEEQLDQIERLLSGLIKLDEVAA